MREKAIPLMIIAMTVIFLFVPQAVTQEPPQPPCWFYGTASIDGLPAQDNQNITASIRGTNLNWTTATNNGTYGWQPRGSSSFYVPYDNSTTPEKDGGADGDTIEFYINGVKTAQTATYLSMDIIRINIFIGSPPDLVPPHILIVSPENKTYSQTDIQLVFNVNETASRIAYSLDGQANQTISGNLTLSNLSVGSHRITVYAEDAAENEGASSPVFFSIETQTQEPFPMWIVAIVLSAALICVVALSFSFRKRIKTKRDNSR